MAKWTDKEEKRLEDLWERGYLTKQIAEEFEERTHGAIRNKVRRMDLDRRQFEWTEERNENLIKHYQDGLTLQEIADQFSGATVKAVQRQLYKLGKDNENVKRPDDYKHKTTNQRWSDREEGILQKLWPKNKAEYIADILDRTVKSVTGKAKMMGLEKDKKYAPILSGHYERANGDMVHYRSKLELRFFKYLDNKDSIVDWDYEPIQIKYTFNGQTKTYTPDLKVTYESGKTVIVEIKPSAKVGRDKNIAKFAEAEQQFSTFEVWTEEALSTEQRHVRAEPREFR